MSVYDQIFIVKNNRSISLDDWIEATGTADIAKLVIVIGIHHKGGIGYIDLFF